jgi:transcriptional regulator with XRE-family HTH domain
MAPSKKPLKPAPGIGRPLSHARRSLRLDQRQLGARLGLGARTISRWENGLRVPPHGLRPALLEALRGAPPELLAALARGLRLPAPAAPAPPSPPISPSASPVDLAAARTALDDILYLGADELDVSPRRLRAVVVDLLRGMVQLSLPAEVARAALAARERRRPAAPGGAARVER